MGALNEPVATTYDTDFLAWTEQQAAALQRGDWATLDIVHLVEEVESMGRQQRTELKNRLTVLLTHLLKLDVQPQATRQHRSWRLSVIEQRLRVQELVDENPSLRPALDASLAAAFASARIVVARETGVGLEQLPERSPFSDDEAMTRPMGDAL